VSTKINSEISSEIKMGLSKQSATIHEIKRRYIRETEKHSERDRQADREREVLFERERRVLLFERETFAEKTSSIKGKQTSKEMGRARDRGRADTC